jgi:hypothetical protein
VIDKPRTLALGTIASSFQRENTPSVDSYQAPFAPPIQPRPGRRFEVAIMDLSQLKDAVSNMTMYDIKAGVRKVQNGKSSLSTRNTATSNPLPSCHELYRNGGQG